MVTNETYSFAGCISWQYAPASPPLMRAAAAPQTTEPETAPQPEPTTPKAAAVAAPKAKATKK